MGLKDLSTATMITIGEHFSKDTTSVDAVDPSTVDESAFVTLSRDPLLKSYLPLIASVTVPLITMNATAGAIKGQIGEMTRDLLNKDATGDGLIGGFDDFILGAIAICTNEALKASLLEARIAALGSDGRARLVNAPYSALMGEAVQMEARLKPDHWKALDLVRVDDVTASDVLRRWMSIAHEISKLDAQRSILRTKDDNTDISRSEVLKARNLWIRTLNAFLNTVEISTLSDADRARVLAPLHEAEQKATEARLRKGATPTTPPTTSPTTPPTT